MKIACGRYIYLPNGRNSIKALTNSRSSLPHTLVCYQVQLTYRRSLLLRYRHLVFTVFVPLCSPQRTLVKNELTFAHRRIHRLCNNSNNKQRKYNFTRRPSLFVIIDVYWLNNSELEKKRMNLESVYNRIQVLSVVQGWEKKSNL